jgi:hypothetical protein
LTSRIDGSARRAVKLYRVGSSDDGGEPPMARSFLPCHNAIVTAAGSRVSGESPSFQSIAFTVRRARRLLNEWTWR